MTTPAAEVSSTPGPATAKGNTTAGKQPPTRFMGLSLIAIAVGLCVLVFMLWPEAGPKTNGEPTWVPTIRWLGVALDAEARLLLLVMLVSALGSYVHAATSWVSYVGNETLRPSWTWWYVLRPFIGTALGLLFYFLVRGGFLSATSDPSQVNLYGLVALSGLAGLFSKQAVDKLREVFDNLFRTAEGGDAVRRNKLGSEQAVKDLMIPPGKISALRLTDDQTAADIPILDVYEKFGGIVTRLPILNGDGAVLHVLHQSLVYKFLSAEVVAAKKGNTQFDPDQSTLEDFLQAEGMHDLVSRSLAFVPITATLGQAKRKMEDTPKCQDVFVTDNGLADEPVRGWLTNVEIARASSA